MLMRGALPACARPRRVPNALPDMWPAVGSRGGRVRTCWNPLHQLPLARGEAVIGEALYILALPLAIGVIALAQHVCGHMRRCPLPLRVARLRRKAALAHQREALAWMRRQGRA